MKYWNTEFPTQEGPEEVEAIPAPEHDDRYTAWEIASILDILYNQALETGEAHSSLRVQNGKTPTPRAHHATTAYKAIEIIKQLQEQLEDLREKYDDRPDC